MMYWTFYWILRFLYKVFCRWEIHGIEHFPLRGGFILAVNHQSYVDPTIAGSASPRGIYYLARESLMKNGLIRWFLTSIHVIPLDIGVGDIGAFKQCVETLHEGKPVLIFPEGTRSHDGVLRPGKPGIGLLAMMGKTDILPCYIHGSYEMFPRHGRFPQPHKLHVFFGPYLQYNEFNHLKMKKESYHKISQRVMDEIGKLRARAQSLSTQ